MTAGEVAHALLALPRHFADPRLAWPAAVRPEIPTPAAFYAGLALALVIAAAIVAVVVRVRGIGCAR